MVLNILLLGATPAFAEEVNDSFKKGMENWLVICNCGPGTELSLETEPELYCFIDACLGPADTSGHSWAEQLVSLAATGKPVYVFYSDADTVPAKLNRIAAIWLEKMAEDSSDITKSLNVYFVIIDGKIGTINLFHLPSQEEALQKAAEELANIL